MREFFATVLSLAIIVCTVWGIFGLLVFGVDLLSSIGIPRGLLYFVAGICFAASYTRIGRWFANFCDGVWERMQRWIVW